METIFELEGWSIKRKGYTIYLCHKDKPEPIRETALCMLGMEVFKSLIFEDLYSNKKQVV